jgi:PAS domain S-box-containing protein
MSESFAARRENRLETSIPQAGASLESILCTEELRRRVSRPPDYEKENRALVALMGALADSPSSIFQTLAETILDITQCDSAGLSLLTRDGKTPDVSGKRFYWPAIAGMWNPHVGGGTPRNFGPCGDVLDQNRTLLFRHFERRYPYLVPVNPAAEECLLVPFYVAGEAVGTIWGIMHSDRRKFDAEDDRVMASLGKFASSAYQAVLHIENLKFQVAEREKAEAEVRELAKGLEAKIRRLVDANILGIVMWTVEGAIVGANEAFLRMVQYDREDVASGRVRWRDMTPDEWREHDERALAEINATGVCQPYEKELFREDGSRVPVLVAGAVSEAGGSEGVGFALDLSDQKRAEAEIRALKDQLYRENLALRDEIDRASMFEEIVGTSDTLRAVLSGIAKVAPTDSTVFITGETGTGKELIARALHKRSQRSARAFVSVNCAALAPSLISSELFGHEKGAFTGATQRRLGRFELADGGTIFLDEVGELPPDTQVALLRVLQEREFERVGGTQSIKVDVRVIAATNRDLKAAVAKGNFREDLFYRLNVFPIEVPPLRERRDDILMLVEYFVQRYAKRAGKSIQSIDKKTLELLRSYDWPGNIRELQNVIERSVVLSSGDILSVDDLWLSKGSSPRAPRVEASEGEKGKGEPWNEREIIEAALAQSRGRVSGLSGAAAKLRIAPSTLEHRIKALKIDKSKSKYR